MTKKWKSWLVMLVAALLVCGISCGDKAYAAEKYVNNADISEDGIVSYEKVQDPAEAYVILEADKYYSSGDVSTVEDELIVFSTFAELKELASKVYSTYTSVYYDSETPLVIEEDLTLPAYLHLSTMTYDTKIIVPAGVTLTVENRANIWTYTYEIKGTLVNNGTINIGKGFVITGVFQNNSHVWINNQAVIRLEEGGMYKGTGELSLPDQDGTLDLSQQLIGFDLNNFEKNYEYETWILRDMSGLIRLDAPTDLRWGIDFETRWNPETQERETVAIEMPGAISWKFGEVAQNKARVLIYKEGETEPVRTHNWSFGSMENRDYISVDSFCMDDLESGTYYFTVTVRGDYTQYSDSETVVSEKWTYVKPDEKLPICTNLVWDWPRFSWDGVTDVEDIGYEVEYYFAATAEEEPICEGGSWWRHNNTNGQYDDYQIQRYGNGYYYFKVRALSPDITKVCNGEWSVLSEPYILTDLSSKVEDELNDIINSAVTAEEIKDSVQSMDTEELKSAMLADQDNTSTVDMIAELENAVGGPAPVEVSQEVAAFDVKKVSIIGANLNNAASETDPIELVIDKPEKEDVIPEAYDNAVAVRFSMTLENVADPENLEVPVKITLPVPATINPEFLVILHYHAATSAVEELRPYIYNEGGQYYASFVLTSFSDFVMTQTVPKIEFEDVEEGAYYEEAVQWAVAMGITNGYGSATTFCPDIDCTRGQVVTFLWRAAGSPEPTSLVNPFTDVASDAYYYKAVLWAVEQGITSGYGSATIFNPDGVCNRAQVATFLWRAGAKPSMSGVENKFTDIDSDAYYYEAVLWAVHNGITNGYGSDTIFNPDGNCTRGQIVTFLYRAIK